MRFPKGTAAATLPNETASHIPRMALDYFAQQVFPAPVIRQPGRWNPENDGWMDPAKPWDFQYRSSWLPPSVEHAHAWPVQRESVPNHGVAVVAFNLADCSRPEFHPSSCGTRTGALRSPDHSHRRRSTQSLAPADPAASAGGYGHASPFSASPSYFFHYHQRSGSCEVPECCFGMLDKNGGR
jgi:hypothetical protein